MDPVSTGPRHRRESRATRRSPQFPTRAGRRGVPSSLLEPWAPAGLRGIPGRALELRGRAGRMWVRARACRSRPEPGGGLRRDAGALASRGGGSGEDAGVVGRAGGMGSDETAGALGPSPAEIRSGQSAGALDPSVAGMDSSLHAGAADPSSAWKASREPAGGEPAQPDPSGQQAASDVGWFSTVPGGGQYTGALSERLSAERPGDTQPHPTIEREPSVSAARLVLNQPSLRWMDRPSPRNRAAGAFRRCRRRPGRSGTRGWGGVGRRGRGRRCDA